MKLTLPLILDGATGTQLQQRGYTGAQCAEAWVLEHPDTIREIQSDYINAGSDIVYAPTFAANRIKLEENGISGRVAEFNTRLFTLSKENAAGRALVGGDIAPTGKFLPPMGDTSFEELVEVYAEQAAALEAAGADLFAVETMMTLPEARAAVLGIRSVSEKPIFVTFTCGTNGKTLTGTDVTAALVVLQGMGVTAFGLNCSTGPEEMLKQLRRLREYAEIPLICKPNAGLPEMVDGKTVYRTGPETFAALVPQMAGCGVGLFGGCCGTTMEHIRALRQAVDGISFNPPAPAHTDELVASTEKQVFCLPADFDFGEPVPCDEDLLDALEEAEDDEADGIAILLTDEEELENLGESLYAANLPLCFCCEDAALLEKALRLYQGRALYRGSLSGEVLAPLREKYGLLG